MEDNDKDKKKEVVVDDESTVNLNLGADSILQGDMAQRLVELEARVAALESQSAGGTGNTEGNTEGNLSDEAISDVEEAASTQAGDEAIVEEVYEDEEDIVNLRGNLKAAGRVIKRRFNLAGYIAGKTGMSEPANLREANAIMTTFRKTHTALKSKVGSKVGSKPAKWASDAIVRQNAGPVKTNMERWQASLRKGE